MTVRREDCLNVSAVIPRPLQDGFAPGAALRELTANAATGGDHRVVEFPAGWQNPQKGYVTAGQDLYILQGDLAIGDVKLTTGDYTYIPEGVVFDRMSSSAGARAILFHDKAARFVPASADAPHARVEKAIAPQQTWRLPWLDPMKEVVKKSTWVDPNTGREGRPPGVLTKTLRHDLETGEMVALTSLAPGFVDPGTEHHPHDECLYLIAGDAYIGYTYDHKKADEKLDLVLTKDYYISRPPGIRHGPVCTQTGALWLLYMNDKYTGIYREVEDWQQRVGKYMASQQFR